MKYEYFCDFKNMGLKLGFIKFSFFVLIYIGNDDILSVVYVYERDSVNCF